MKIGSNRAVYINLFRNFILSKLKINFYFIIYIYRTILYTIIVCCSFYSSNSIYNILYFVLFIYFNYFSILF